MNEAETCDEHIDPALAAGNDIAEQRLRFAQFIESFAYHVGAGSQACGLVRIERQRKRLQNSLAANEPRQGDRDIADADNIRRRRAHRHHGPLVVENHIDDPR